MGTIITMAGIAIGGMMLEGVLAKAGKMEEAKYVGMTTIAGLAITAVTKFVQLAKTLSSLG
jgi:hypothetical protein